jgi:hypothetical protein
VLAPASRINADQRADRQAHRLSACGRALRPWLGRTLLPAAVLDPSGQASPAGARPCRTDAAGFTAARVLAADASGSRAQQAGKVEARALFAGSQGGTIARAGGNACGPLSARLDLTSYLGLNGFIVLFSIIPRAYARARVPATWIFLSIGDILRKFTWTLHQAYMGLTYRTNTVLAVATLKPKHRVGRGMQRVGTKTCAWPPGWRNPP